jgi:hypothetical protein
VGDEVLLGRTGGVDGQVERPAEEEHEKGMVHLL